MSSESRRNQHENPFVYFSGPLTWYARNADARYKEVLDLASTVKLSLARHGVGTHVPHLEFDQPAGLQTYRDNTDLISRCLAVVAYYDYPSTGMGQEFEIAAAHLRPVVLLVNKRRNTISTMVKGGTFRCIPLIFQSVRDIDERLPEIVSELSHPARPEANEWVGLATRIANRRSELGLTREEFAAALGCSVTMAAHLEGDGRGLNPSLWQLQAVCRALGWTSADLIAPHDDSGVTARILEFSRLHSIPFNVTQRVIDLAARGLDEEKLEEEGIRALFRNATSNTDDEQLF